MRGHWLSFRHFALSSGRASQVVIFLPCPRWLIARRLAPGPTVASHAGEKSFFLCVLTLLVLQIACLYKLSQLVQTQQKP